MRITSTRRGTEVRLDEIESAALAGIAGELLGLLGDSEAVPDDPIEAMVGLSGQDVETPRDPVLARLLPDAYGEATPGHQESAREFRRYTEHDLRATKRAAASTLLAQLPVGGGKVVLDRDDADAWLACLNDLRLALGTALGVTEQTDPGDDDAPQAQALALYGWLGSVQELLLSRLAPRRS